CCSATRLGYAEEVAERGDQLFRVASQAPPGDADDSVPRQRKLLVAHAIAFERSARAVELPAVELDDQVGVRPGGVDFVAVHDGVADRLRQVAVSTYIDKEALEFAACARGLFVVRERGC